MWLHWKYGMSQIIQKIYSLKNPTNITSLLPMMVDRIKKKKLMTCNAQTVE